MDETNTALTAMGVSKLSLVVFARNEVGNAFWEHPGFLVRTDLIYRDRAIVELVRTDMSYHIDKAG